MELDYKTVAYIRHLFAGKLTNIEGGAKMLIEGKTHLSSGQSIAEIIARDSTAIIEILTKLENETK